MQSFDFKCRTKLVTRPSPIVYAPRSKGRHGVAPSWKAIGASRIRNLYRFVALGLGLLWSKMVGSGKCYKAWSNQFLEFVPSSFSQKHSQNVEIWSHASPLILIPRRALVFQQISCCGRSQQFGIGHCPRSLGTSGQDCDHDSMNAFLGPFSQSLFGSHNNTL